MELETADTKTHVFRETTRTWKLNKNSCKEWMNYYFFWQYSLFIWVCLALAWTVSQDTDTSKNTKATLKCCYALHSYLVTVFSHDKLLAWQHPPSWNRDKSSEDGSGRLHGGVLKLQSCTQSSHPMECICQCAIAYIIDKPGDSQSIQLGNATTT